MLFDAIEDPILDPARVFEGTAGVTAWRPGRGPGGYVLEVTDAAVAAPAVARAVVRAGGSLLRLAETTSSLEEAYLAMVREGT